MLLLLQRLKLRGVGKLMIKAIIQKAVELGCYKTILNTSEENAGFYSKLGFNKEQFQFTFRH
jgi:GNAT superfamily N-acetyltransferase